MNQEIRSAIVRVAPFAIMLLVIFLLTKKGRIKPASIALHRPTSYSSFTVWIVGYLLFVVLTELLLYKAGLLELSPWNHPLFPSVVRILGAVILAPVAEELVFRGLILNILMKRKLNLHLAILAQAVFFVLLHNFTWQNTLSSNIGIVQSLVDACLFGYARQFTKSIYTPMTMHVTGNLIATLERFI